MYKVVYMEEDTLHEAFINVSSLEKARACFINKKPNGSVVELRRARTNEMKPGLTLLTLSEDDIKEGREQLFSSPLEVLELSTHSYNSLRRAGIESVGQLLMMSEYELMQIPGFGRCRQEEVAAVLRNYGKILSFGKTKQEIDEKFLVPISMYSISGEFIMTFNSIHEAASAFHIKSPYILDCANKKMNTYCERIWRLQECEQLPESELPPKKRQGRSVSQYDLQGKYIKTFDSLPQAAIATGTTPANILRAAKGEYQQAAGYIWRCYPSSLSVQPLPNTSRAGYKKVSQYNPKGKFIRTFATVKSAAEAVGCSVHSIYDGARTNAKRAGYYWRYFECERLSKKEMSQGNSEKCRRIVQFDLQGKKVKTYKSIKEAAAAVGVTSMAIWRAANGKMPRAAGYIWRYKSK